MWSGVLDRGLRCLLRALETGSATTCVISDSHLGTSLGLCLPLYEKERFELQGP